MELPFGQVLADKHHVVKKEDVHVHLEKERLKLTLRFEFEDKLINCDIRVKLGAAADVLFSQNLGLKLCC